jgi:hypothetical protein
VYNTYQKTISEDAGTGPNASTVVAYFFQDEDAGYHHYQGTSGDFPRAFVIGTAYLLRIVTNLHPPRFLMARWLFEQPHRRQFLAGFVLMYITTFRHMDQAKAIWTGGS